ncbi:MAG: universal stress protein [Alphaproteobacteria bacterium]|nr:universal stress protein [Alphaproteobacteria bacterium]
MGDRKKIDRRKGVFLVVVDETQEFVMAVDYASQFANAEDGYVALLNIMQDVHVQNWMNVEEKVKREMRAQSEQMVWDSAGRVLENTGRMPIVAIEEGDATDIILKTIEENDNIVALVLASSALSNNPGPLVSYFSGKGLHKLQVPLMIIPGNLDPLRDA